MTFIYRHEAFRPCSPRSLRHRLGAFFDSCQRYDEPSTLFSTNTTHEFWSYIWSILSCKTWVFLAATAECEACIPFDGACIDFWCVNACERRYETREGGCVGKYQCQCHIASDYYCSLHLKPCDIGQNLDGRHYWSFYICWSRAGDDIYVDHNQEEILYPCSICNNLVFLLWSYIIYITLTFSLQGVERIALCYILTRSRNYYKWYRIEITIDCL